MRFVLCFPEVVLEGLPLNVSKYFKIQAAQIVMDHLSRDQMDVSRDSASLVSYHEVVI